MALRPDEIGAALVVALDEQLSLKEKQERDARLLERRIEEARAQLEKVRGEYRTAVGELEAQIGQFAGLVEQMGVAHGKSVEALEKRISSFDRAIDERESALKGGLAEVSSSLAAVAAREPLRIVEKIVERQPVIERHTEVVSDGSGVKAFERDDNTLVLTTNDDTKHKVKLPPRVVQRIDQGGGGGLNRTEVVQIIGETVTAPEWGDLTGTLSDQADLQTALDGKEDAGTAAAAITAHEGAADPHTGYQKETEKGANNGYAGLDAGGLVDRTDLPSALAYEDEANTFTDSQNITKSGANGGVGLYLTNTNSGTGAFSQVMLSNDGAGGNLQIGVLGTGFTTSNPYRQDGGILETGGSLSGGLSIRASAGGMRFYHGSTQVFEVTDTATITLADAKNIAVNATTGTKIGTATTQKLGFYNATPVVQRSGAAGAAVATTAATNVAPFGFSTAAQADAIVTLANEMRACLVALGFHKGAA